ncbi:MAG: hypothetical protein IJ858_05955 [Acidaminococcaceae bacterium]|nr:hypothetical protein [Acidaminococcaceae bacterium]
MAVSVKDLIAKKEEIAAKKEATVDFVTSIGTVTVKKPTKSMVLESIERDKTGDAYLILQQVVEPNLKDPALQEAYGCAEPLDIVEKIFLPGEIANLARAIMKTSGYGVDIVEDLKN